MSKNLQPKPPGADEPMGSGGEAEGEMPGGFSDEESGYSGDVGDMAVRPNVYYAVKRFGAVFSRLPRQLRTDSGHQLADMLLSCTWNGRPCDEK